MIVSNDRSRKPFYVGQLVRFVEPIPNPVDYGLDIVLDLRWGGIVHGWQLFALSQRTGKKEWLDAEDFVPVGENNE